MNIENVKIPSTKGNISAVVHHPENGTNKLAILCPGYLDSKDYNHMIRLAEELSKKGFTAARFDPTGTWESKGTIEDYKTSQYLQDIRNVIDYMIKRRKYNQIVLCGHSRGGFVSIVYAAEDSRISKVIGIFPSSNKTMTPERRRVFQENGFKTSKRDSPFGGEVEFKVPFSHVEDREKFSPIESVKEIRVPVVLFAGELDTDCSPEVVKEIYDNANNPKKFIIIPSVDHDYRKDKEMIDKVNDYVLEEIE